MGRIYKNENQLLLLEMLEIYQPGLWDWMQYQITNKNTLTLHHIRKQSDNGLVILSNGALLTKKAHQILNKLEDLYYSLYIDWNDLFFLINVDKQPPCDYYVGEARKLKKHTQKILY